MHAAPVLCPINVTALLSPPNASILSLIHCNAAIWSSKPKLLDVWSLKPGFKKPKGELCIKRIIANWNGHLFAAQWYHYWRYDTIFKGH